MRCLLCLSLLLAHPVLAAIEFTIDFSKTNGIIRSLHGVNMGPLCYRGMVDLSAYHRELGVPFTRLHDVVWVNAEAVDIHTIFRDFRNDPAQPESYDFRQTDDYLQSIINVGSQIVYRLGESIEHTPHKYHVHPPPDAEKWAAICIGIIRHYNEGWANGFHHNIRYWEIWNEPDVRPAMWTGSDEQYLHLYEVAAKAIKRQFPQLKVGGPALGHSGDFKSGTFEPSPFLAKFLEHCRETDAPLDFYSWHRYTRNPADFARWAWAIRGVLDRAGFPKAESHLNEWNYLPRGDWGPMMKEGAGRKREEWFAEMSGAAGAAFAAWTLISLQDAPVDLANFYTGEIQGFGLFNFHGVPNKSFYAFKAFKQLLETPVRVSVDSPARLAMCAGISRDAPEVNILFSNFESGDEQIELEAKQLPWDGSALCSIHIVDATHDLTKTREITQPANRCKLAFDLKAPSVCLIRVRKRG